MSKRRLENIPHEENPKWAEVSNHNEIANTAH